MILELKTKVLLRRLARGFITGFIGSALSIGGFAGHGITDLKDWIFVLSVAGLAGGITGAMLAIDKYMRWEEDLDNKVG